MRLKIRGLEHAKVRFAQNLPIQLSLHGLSLVELIVRHTWMVLLLLFMSFLARSTFLKGVGLSQNFWLHMRKLKDSLSGWPCRGLSTWKGASPLESDYYI